MRKIFCCFILILNVSYYYSQAVIPVASQSDINKFLKSNTLVVLKNDRTSDYNDAIREAVEKFWNITSYEFIYESDFKKYMKDPGKSFLMINQVYFEKDKTQTLFDFLILANGGNYNDVNDMPTIAAVPLCYNGALESEYSYKMGAIVKFVQLHVKTCKENPSLNKDNIAKYYLEKSGSPRKKTLYLLKTEIEPEIRTKNSFASVYPFAFEYAEREDIKKLIDKEDEDAIMLHLIKPKLSTTLSYCVKIIFDAKSGLIYYYDSHKITEKDRDYLLKSDIKKLASKK